MPGDDMQAQMARLFVELLGSTGLTELMRGGALYALRAMTQPRMGADLLAVCSMLFKMDICRLLVAHLRAIGSPAEWVVSAASMCYHASTCAV